MDCLDLLFFVAVALLVLTKGGKIPRGDRAGDTKGDL